MMEYFAASSNPPLEECLARVSGSEHDPPCDLLIAIVAHRLGWVPEDQNGSEDKSITRLECEEARKNGKGTGTSPARGHFTPRGTAAMLCSRRSTWW